MGRFDRNDTEGSKLPASLDVATDELEAFIESRVGEIMATARERAAQIEREAHESAEGIMQEAQRNAEGILEDAFNRAWRMLDGIDLLESGVGDLIGALRGEMEGFAADLGAATPAEGSKLVPREPGERPPRAALPPAPVQTPPATQPPDHAVEADHAAAAIGATGESHDGSHAEVEQMIIEQVAGMMREGMSRSDAERFVMRFKQGDRYLHVLDEIYAPDNARDAGKPVSPPPAPLIPQRVRWGFRLRRS
jgi:hypothetical protein